MCTAMITLFKTKRQQLVNAIRLQKQHAKGNTENEVPKILSKQRLKPYIVSTVETKRPAGLSENSVLFDKYTLAQEEYFHIRI